MTSTRKRLSIAAVFLFVFGVIFFLYEREDPAKWVVGKWLETQQGVTVHVTPERGELVSKNERRKYSFTYTFDTWESPYEVSIYRGGNFFGTALVEFDGKDRVILKKKPVSGDGDLAKMANDYASIWVRLKQ